MIFICGAVMKTGRFPKKIKLLLWLSPIVFLTAALVLQTAAGRIELLASRILIDALGQIPATILLFIVLAMEILGMIKLAGRYREPEDGLINLGEVGAYLRRAAIFLGLREAEENAEYAGYDEPTLEDKPSMAFPSFPDRPEPLGEELFAEEDVPSDLFQRPPEKPVHPAAAPTDPELSDLIRKTLFGPVVRGAADAAASSSAGADCIADHPAAGGSPAASADGTASEEDSDDIEILEDSGLIASAFPPPSDLTPIPQTPRGIIQEAADAEEYDEVLSDDSDPAFAFLAGEDDFSEDDDSFDLMETLPEEDRDIDDISEKLAPQGTSPKGIVTPSKPKTKPRRKKKYEVPVEGVLAEYPDADFESIDENTQRGAEVLEQTLKEFKIEAKVTGIRRGPVITMYELLPSPGVKISSIVNLQDNIALRLAASRVRIVAPIPGKHAIGIEVPNKKRAIVSFSSMVESEEFRESDAGIPVILGKDISGGNQVIDLTRTPHLLIAGATGAGKSVCVNSLIASVLYSKTPQEVKMIMVDPKIVELKLYNDIPHLLTPVITEPKRALQALQWCLYEMERRYSLLDTQGVRDIKTFNRRVKDRKLATEPLPYIVVIVDEFADLMATSGKELEGIVARLAAMSRAVGIHLVLATQRPSVDVITGLIKANFPSRIAFMVAQKTDSRIIIDAMGADKLLGRGDMLFTSAWDPFPSRMQGAFLAEEEVERLAEHVKTLGEPEYLDDEMFFDDEDEDDFQLESAGTDDPMYEKALEIVVSSRKASASYLQRRLKIGYNRAARLVEEMERRGIVGPANGSKPRDLIHVPERFSSPAAEEREPSYA